MQLTPPGSACSITIGTGLTKAEPGTYQGTHLVVNDIEAARAELVERGVEISEPFHFTAQGQQTGLHPDRVDYGTFLSFEDPDGNGWTGPGGPEDQPRPAVTDSRGGGVRG